MILGYRTRYSVPWQLDPDTSPAPAGHGRTAPMDWELVRDVRAAEDGGLVPGLRISEREKRDGLRYGAFESGMVFKKVSTGATYVVMFGDFEPCALKENA